MAKIKEINNRKIITIDDGSRKFPFMIIEPPVSCQSNKYIYVLQTGEKYIQEDDFQTPFDLRLARKLLMVLQHLQPLRGGRRYFVFSKNRILKLCRQAQIYIYYILLYLYRILILQSHKPKKTGLPEKITHFRSKVFPLIHRTAAHR